MKDFRAADAQSGNSVNKNDMFQHWSSHFLLKNDLIRTDLCLCVCVCVRVWLRVSLSLYICLSLSVYMCMCISLSL